MANETTKMGLIPVRKVGGQSWTGGQQRYRIASGATTAIFQGDLVTQLTAGTIGRHAASGTVPILGVFNGCSYTDPTSGETVFSNSYPGSIAASDIVANVIDDPMVQFSIQSDEAFRKPFDEVLILWDGNRSFRNYERLHMESSKMISLYFLNRPL